MTLLLLFLLLALGVSFICSILEAVILSITPSFIAEERKKGSPLGEKLLLVKQDIDRSLAAILSLNTIAHTIGAAGVGAQAGKVFGEAYFGIISAVLTLLILVFSEIIPKTLGANYWRKLTPYCIPVLKIVELSMLPLVSLSKLVTAFMKKRHNNSETNLSDITALAWVSEKEGLLSPEESKVIHSIIELRSMKARDAMTPRTVIFSLDDSLAFSDVISEHTDIPFSRIPIYQHHPDKIHAFIRKDELLLNVAKGHLSEPLHTIARPLLTVPSTKNLLELQRDMSKGHYQVAMVVNEYGDIKGMVTMEDIVETMLGLEIVDETDSHPDMQELAKKRWQEKSKPLPTEEKS